MPESIDTVTWSPLPEKTAAKTTLDAAAEQKDMFLKLLVAQLKNQDPTSPMDQKDMMAQMAQFTTVEQITNMANTMQRVEMAQSVALIGKQVNWVDGNQTVHEGATVTGVATTDGQTQLVLADGTRIKPSAVVLVE